MATIPETNQKLWSTLRRIYTAQRNTAQEAVSELVALGDREPDLAKDPIARDELASALARQKGQLRFAESQLTLVDVMSGYWDQRRLDPVAGLSDAGVPRSNLIASGAPRLKLGMGALTSPERAVGSGRA
jgi:hypothetical protein